MVNGKYYFGHWAGYAMAARKSRQGKRIRLTYAERRKHTASADLRLLGACRDTLVRSFDEGRLLTEFYVT